MPETNTFTNTNGDHQSALSQLDSTLQQIRDAVKHGRLFVCAVNKDEDGSNVFLRLLPEGAELAQLTIEPPADEVATVAVEAVEAAPAAETVAAIPEGEGAVALPEDGAQPAV